MDSEIKSIGKFDFGVTSNKIIVRDRREDFREELTFYDSENLAKWGILLHATSETPLSQKRTEVIEYLENTVVPALQDENESPSISEKILSGVI